MPIFPSKSRLAHIVFEHDDKASKNFDLAILILIAGTLMFLVEGPENGFTSIGMSMYWAIVTLTTVGYGDISPITPYGKFLASVIMLLGYAIIAVPTGIVTSELTLANSKSKKKQGKTCRNCKSKGLDLDAAFCKFCGESL